MDKPAGKKQLTSAFDLFGKSSDTVKRNLKTFAILNIVPFIFVLAEVFSSDSYRAPASTNTPFAGIPVGNLALLTGAAIIGGLAVAIIMIFIETMLTKLQLSAAAGKQPTLSELWKTAKKYWLRLLGLYIVMGLYILVGLILLIVPGLIMIRRYYLAPYFLIDKDLSITTAMRQSADATKPHSGYIWSIIGVSILLSLFGVIPIIGGLISFALGVLYSCAPALRYYELKTAKSS